MFPNKAIRIYAPAKINLYLHVTGKRPDGYHLLDSLFVFADISDEIHIKPSKKLSFSIEGEFAENLKKEKNNIVIKATKILAKALGIIPLVKIKLIKKLPVAAGLGGGSADAAAVLIGLSQLWESPLSKEKLAEIALQLGADVPACLQKCPLNISGIGEIITKAPPLPKIWIVLVNPKVKVPTPDVFKKRAKPFTTAMPIKVAYDDIDSFVLELKKRSNDLTESACSLAPEIADTLEIISQQHGCLISRMSGSGATCFGLFANKEHAETAVRLIKSKESDWWAISTLLF